MLEIDLEDENLFGKLAGEDEDDFNLDNIFIESEAFTKINDDQKLRILMARKGMGKSTILKVSAIRNSKNNSNIVIRVNKSDLTSILKMNNDIDEAEMTNDWEKRICTRIVYELGKKIGLAVTDDAMSIVESAEINGFKSRNIISAASDRLQIKLKTKEIEASRIRVLPENYIEVLKRYQENDNYTVWLYIDDIDNNFKNTPNERAQLAAFFTALRYTTNSINGIKIRTSIRTDVWTAIEEIEGMDKITTNYITQIKWSEYDISKMLAVRINNYLLNIGHLAFDPNFDYTVKKVNERVNIVLEKMPWGRNTVRPTIPIYIFSNGRPRFALKLCKLAAKSAQSKRRRTIRFDDIKKNLDSYGKERYLDIIREHGHQCKDIKKVFLIFNNGKASYSTQELLNLIETKLKEEKIEIQDKIGYATNADIAKFIFKTDFITATDEKGNYFWYENEPDLFEASFDLDKGYKWTIQTCFRDYFRISDY